MSGSVLLERIAAAEERGRLQGLAESERVLQERLAAVEASHRESELKSLQDLVMRQLKRRLVNLPSELDDRVKSLSSSQLEALGDDLLDFTQIDDLLSWLSVIDK
jgi:hypothetical protein